MERHFKQEKLKIEVLNIREEREHFHQDIELLFVLEGTLDVAMGEQTTHMQPEDILVINANKRHCLKGSPDILFARLYITYQLVSDISKVPISFSGVTPPRAIRIATGR